MTPDSFGEMVALDAAAKGEGTEVEVDEEELEEDEDADIKFVLPRSPFYNADPRVEIKYTARVFPLRCVSPTGEEEDG